MIRQSEAARTAAQFLSFGSFFLSCPLGLWDSCLFAQISFDRVLEVAVVDGLCVAGFMASLALGLGSMARGTARVPKPLAVAGALVYGMGLCLYAVIQGADVPVSAFGAAVMGAAIGAGLAVVVVGWCRLLARFGLRRSLVGLGIACGAAAFGRARLRDGRSAPAAQRFHGLRPGRCGSACDRLASQLCRIGRVGSWG